MRVRERKNRKVLTVMILWLFAALTLDSILNQPELVNSYYGIYVQRLDNERVIYSYNSRKLFIPASNMKLVTTAAALSTLGKDFCYKTKFGYRGVIAGTELKGDLIIVGGGDPTLSLDCLDRFSAALEKAGIFTIRGNIVVDDRYFVDERLPVGWSWHYLDAKYAAEISALSINKNCVNVRMEAGKIGDYADVSIEPATAYVRLYSQMMTWDREDSLIIYRKPEANIIYVDGAIRANHERNISVAVRDPALFVGTLFKEKLLSRNINFYGDIIKNYALDSVVILDSVISPKLVEIVKETNKESENLYAEVLLKTMGAEKMQAGSFIGGIAAVKKFLNGCSVETSAVSLWDGSGLSKHNLISPRNIVDILRVMHNDSLSDDFSQSLAMPGSGTLEYRFSGFKDSLHAKTGAIHAVSCLSGYLKVNDIECGFSLMFNNYTCSLKKIMDIQEKIINAIADYLRERD